MNKKLLLSLMVFCFACFGVARAQTNVEIGDGTETQYYVPIGTYYNYSITEQLYTADEIGMAGNIISISFNYAGTAAKDFPITVYMKHVEEENLASAGISLADAEEVFNGTLSVTGAGWVTIDLDTPFAYDGNSNLLIGINKGYVYWYSGGTWYSTPTSATMARYTQNDNNAYDLTTTPGSAQANRPNIQMTILPSGGTICEKPDTFTIVEGTVTTNSAIFNWTGGSGSYNFQYKKSTDDEYLNYPTQATAFSLEGLEPGTTYNVRVQSVCGEDVSGWKSITFTTLFGIPLVEEFGTSIPAGWAQYTGLLGGVMADTVDLEPATYGWSFGENNGVFDNHARVNIYGTSCMKWLVLPEITMENNVQLKFDMAYTAYSGTGAPALTGTDDKFVVLINANGTWHILRQWDNAGSNYVLNDLGVTPTTMKLDLSAYAGQVVAVAFYGESTISNADNNMHIDNVSIDYIPACDTPASLAVNYTGGTTATVTWEMADKCDIDVNGTVYTNKTSPFEITGLEYATVYSVQARQNCGAAGTSDWVGPVTFTTKFCADADMCAITFEVTDSYGDGWNGASIDVLDYQMFAETQDYDAALIAEISNTSDAGAGVAQTYTLNVCDGRPLIFNWVSGNYDSEASYVVYDPQGDEIINGSAGFDAFVQDLLCETTCRRPTNFEATDVYGRTATLSWTENGQATEWTIYYMAVSDTVASEVVVTTNPYTLEGLTPLTTYYAEVIPTCEIEKPSEVISWTTTELCPAPRVTVEPYPTSATVSWTGAADAYEFEWAEVPQAPAKDGLWLQYDDDTYVGAIGNSSANTWTWGVMYPADMLEGNGLVSKVAIYETSTYNTEDITINIYSGGDDAPGELVYTETVTPEAANAFHEITLAELVTVDPSQNLWITLTEYGTYVMPYCQNGDNANNDWVLSGSWAHIGDLASSLAGDTWMIRGYVEPSFDPNELDWQAVSGATSPYTLEPLTPNTTYAVRIKALCGGEDGESNWATVTFTTPDACYTPDELTAEAAATTADLSWTAYTDSYNLKYRHTEPSTEPATIILEAHDVWEDGSGYQMLLDPSHSLFGDVIPTTGPLTSSCDVSAELYDPFTYTIPENADPSCDPENFVFDGFITLEIPAGTYDWCIVNPSADDKIWIAGEGDIPGRYDDYVFEAGVTYHFTMQKFGTGDGAAFDIDRPMSDWIFVENISNPYTLTDLNPLTYYEWQVQGIACSGGDNTDWSEIANFFTTEVLTVDQTIALATGWNWISVNVDITLDDLKAALVAALPNANSIVIKAQDGKQASYNGSGWRGQLNNNNFNLSNRYNIKVFGACEIVLNGMAIDPAELPVTISNGANWIGFPLSWSMTVGNAFGQFPTNGDVIKSQSGANAKFNNGSWRPNTFTLEPGQGYLYKSNATGDNPFVYPSQAKAAGKSSQKGNVLGMECRKDIKAMENLISIDLKPVENEKPILPNFRNRKTVDLIINKK